MQKKFLITALLLCYESVGYASTELTTALDNVRQNCGNISAELLDMKTMAGINTGVTAVGAVAGGAATAVGVAKSSLDAQLEAFEKLPMLKIEDERAFEQELRDYARNLENMKTALNDKGDEKSRKLGNWRTGLLATNTATNIAGAAIAGSNRIKGDLQSQINNCISGIDNLSRVLGQARVLGTDSDADIIRAQKVVTECGMWATVNLSSVNKRANGATASSGVGAGLGLAGTISSVMANSKSVRSGDEQKEKNLNTMANVMAGGATVASVTATVFNATQISAIKRAAEVADRCEEALK